jgi:SAM-dependent methyltransferase
MELLIGCGTNRDKRMGVAGQGEWSGLVTLDIEPSLNPDVVWDLNDLPLPFEAGAFDEIHAYEVLEHVGRQGDWRFFFAQFDDFHRILKPGGYFFATVPSWRSPWAWGDPGHTRVLMLESLTFLSRESYEQVGTTCMTDYRPFYKGDFRICGASDDGQTVRFILQKVAN